MTIFDILNNCLTYKVRNFIDDTVEYLPFMVNRWCSFCTPISCHIINLTANMYWTVFLNDNVRHHNFLCSVLPKFEKKQFIKYIKKKKEDVILNKDYIFLAQHTEISKREVELYKQLFNIEIPSYEQKTSRKTIN